MKSYYLNNKSKIALISAITFLLVSLTAIRTLSAYERQRSDEHSLLSPYILSSKLLSIEKCREQQQIRLEIDSKYCNGRPCRFLNFLGLAEQETRAQLHLRHLSFTAGLVNRTIVLPNVSGSRLGSCLPYDFEYYYDIEWAKKNAQYFNYITMKDFIAWIKERKLHGVPVEDQVLSIFDKRSKNVKKPTSVMHCFSGYTTPVSPLNQVISWNTDKNISQYRENMLLDLLQTGSLKDMPRVKNNSDIEVLHLQLHGSNAFSHIKEADIPIPYSAGLVNFADAISQSLGSYIAVHWRMEKARNARNLVNCAMNLVSLLEEKGMNTSQVFLLTDYPHTFTAEQQALAVESHASQQELLKWLQSTSGTFGLNQFTDTHHKAIQYLFQHHPFSLFETTMNSNLIDPPKNWNLMPVPQSLKRINVAKKGGGVEMIDSGWLGILDKLMAIRSHHFFAGEGDQCGRGKSTFTKQIVAERTLNGKSEVHYFGNVV